jgi:hypothetical protein
MNTNRAREKSSIALIGGTLIDGTGRSAFKDSMIIIDGNRIKDVGIKKQMKIPEEATVIDARARSTLLQGSPMMLSNT